MLDNWNGQVGWATIFSVLSFLGVSGGGILIYVKGLGIREADHIALGKRFSSLEDRVTAAEARYMPSATIDKRFEDTDRGMGAITANAALLREQFSENSLRASEVFATKIEVAALEERTTKGMDRIVDRLEQISGRLETIGDMIVKSLAERRA